MKTKIASSQTAVLALSLLFGFGPCLTLLAQSFPTRPGSNNPRVSPIRRLAPTGTLAQNSPVVRRTSPPATEPLLDLAFPDVEIRDVLEFYKTHTGKRFIWDNSVTGTVYIVAKSVPRSEALRLIESTLLLNGITLVPMDDKTIKVLGSKNARSQGIPLLNRPDQLPVNSEQVVSYLIQLRYSDPAELQQVLSQSFPASAPYGSILALPQSRALLVTESSTVIKRILVIIDTIDVAPAPVDVYSIALQNADAANLSELLNEIITTDDRPQASVRQLNRPNRTNANNNNANQNNQPDTANNAPAASFIRSEDSVVLGVVKITPDTRTNKLHITSREENMPFLRGLIAELDADAAFGVPERIALRYITAEEMFPIIQEILTEAGEEVVATEAAATRGGGNNAGGGANNTPLGSSSGGIGSGTQNAPSGLGVDLVETTPQAFSVGTTRVVVDRRTDGIIVMGTRADTAKVRNVIRQLDLPTIQVYINTVVGELSLEEDENFGLDIFRPNIGDPDFAGQISNNGIGAFSPFDFETVADFASIATGTGALSGFTAFFNAGDTSFVLRALESQNRLRIVTRPRLVVENHKRGVLVSGEEVAVPVSSTSTFTDGDAPLTSSSIQFRSISLVLEVVPHVTQDNEVTMEIFQRLDSQSGSSTIDGNSVPTIATRTLSTRVRVPDRHTVVLGGLVSDEKRKSKSGALGLSRIPIIGDIFSAKDTQVDRSELLILMTPYVIQKPQQLRDAREPIMEEYYQTADPVGEQVIPYELRRSNSEEDGDSIKVETGQPAEYELPQDNSASSRRGRPENAKIIKTEQASNPPALKTQPRPHPRGTSPQSYSDAYNGPQDARYRPPAPVVIPADADTGSDAGPDNQVIRAPQAFPVPSHTEEPGSF